MSVNIPEKTENDYKMFVVSKIRGFSENHVKLKRANYLLSLSEQIFDPEIKQVLVLMCENKIAEIEKRISLDEHYIAQKNIQKLVFS